MGTFQTFGCDSYRPGLNVRECNLAYTKRTSAPIHLTKKPNKRRNLSLSKRIVLLWLPNRRSQSSGTSMRMPSMQAHGQADGEVIWSYD
jgi:hypothetical protein